ncbi:hypothetical protein [Halalkalibacter krulwichiae]|uniref:Uncharacterized protein n=1 Tax=Halalkalibacter krulwichiae TaxID=199441 RepID=A0A1X9MKI5_9BACI|nr:hypothetical protein [Halalkalibacter krulwichiae]ARK32171.1 hypothetical protein BkAM31D_21260 [Halalkalibacter krulwichiae]
MEKVIKSVGVIGSNIDQRPNYDVGEGIYYGGPVIAYIVEEDSTFFFFDKEDNLLMEIRNCPVVVRYQIESEE